MDSYSQRGERTMVYLLIGAVSMAGFGVLVRHVQNRRLTVTWWQWLLTVFCFIYAVFVLATIASFLEEGSIRGALVMGMIMGIIAVVWGVLLGRFVFSRRYR